MLLKQIEQLNITTIAVKTFFIGLFFFSLVLLGTVCYFSYDKFTFLLVSHYGKLNKLELFRSHYLTPLSYLFIRASSFILLGGSIFVLAKLSRVAGFFASKIISFCQSIRQFGGYLLEYYFKLRGAEKLIFFLIIILIAAVKWFFLTRYYFQIDEMFSYLFFVKKGFLVLVSYYPGPNNHILYSLIAYLLQPLFPDPFYLMKVPSFLASMLTSCVFFFLLLRYYSFQLSILGTVLLSFSGNFFFYSLFGRGYVLITFFAVVSAFLVLEIISGKSEKFKWHMYVVFSILGFYTMPSYLYTFTSFVGAIAVFIVYKKQYAAVRPFLYYHFIVVLAVLFLYTPVVLVSGLSSLTSNPWVRRIEWNEFLSVLPQMIESGIGYITNIEKGAVGVGMTIIAGAALILWKTNRKPLFLLIGSLFVTPLLILLIQHVRPYDRVWTYLIFPFSFCLVILLEFFLIRFQKFSWIKNLATSVMIIGITGHTILFFYENSRHGYGIYDEVGRISREVVREGNGKIYTNEDVYNIYIRYEAALEGKELIPEMSTTGKEDYRHVLLIPGSSFPPSLKKDNYLLKERNSYIEVYQLK